VRVESKTMVFTVVKFLSGSTLADQNGQWESTDKDAGDDGRICLLEPGGCFELLLHPPLEALLRDRPDQMEAKKMGRLEDGCCALRWGRET
jgi:hypothetical protein